MEPVSDEGAKLMLRFQSGDDAAFAEIFERFKTKIFQLAFRYFNDQDKAEDMTQAVFVRAYQAKSSYRPTAKLSTWLYRIAANRCLNELRDRRRCVPLGTGSEETGVPELQDRNALDAAEELQRSEIGQAVAQALQKLPETQRALVILVYYQELSIVEAARTLGITALGARLRLLRARRSLKGRLAAFSEPETFEGYRC